MLVLDGMWKKRYVISVFKSTHNTRQIRVIAYLFYALKIKNDGSKQYIAQPPLVPWILHGILNRRLCLQS